MTKTKAHNRISTIQDKRGFKNYLHPDVPYRRENEEAMRRDEALLS